jgi:hypothetical protein
MSIKPVLVPDHDAASLRKLMDHFAEASTGPTKKQLNESRAAVAAAQGVAESDPLANRDAYAKQHQQGQVYKTHYPKGENPFHKAGMKDKRSTKMSAYDISNTGPKGVLPESDVVEGAEKEYHVINHKGTPTVVSPNGKMNKNFSSTYDAQQFAKKKNADSKKKRVSESDSGTVDMKGKKCTTCKKGTYQETGIQDNMHGELHCTKCNTVVKSRQPADSKKKRVSEGPDKGWVPNPENPGYYIHRSDLPQTGKVSDPAKAKLGRIINKYFGQIYDYGDGDESLNYLDNNAPSWNSLFDKHDGDIDAIIANEPADVLKQAALELKNVANDLKYELDESENLNEFLAPDGSNYGGGGGDESRQFRVIITLYDDSSAEDETAERKIGITVTATSEKAACDLATTMLLKSPRYDGSRITNVTARPVLDEQTMSRAAKGYEKTSVSEGIMDVVKQTFNDCVAGYPQGTSEGQFLQGWARAIRAETGRDIPAEKLTKLYQDYTQRSPEIMQSHGTIDEGKELKAIDGDYYEDSTDFFSMFDQDHFDREEESEDGMEIRGYIDDVCVMVFKFSTPDRMGGWGNYDDSALVAEGHGHEHGPDHTHSHDHDHEEEHDEVCPNCDGAGCEECYGDEDRDRAYDRARGMERESVGQAVQESLIDDDSTDIRELLNFNLFRDYESFKDGDIDPASYSPEEIQEWEQLFAAWGPVADQLERQINKAAAKGAVLTPEQNQEINDNWYDGSDAYDDPLRELPGIYGREIPIIRKILRQSIKDLTGLAEAPRDREDDERHDLDPSDWYIVIDGKLMKASVYPNQHDQARAEGFSPTREQARARAANKGMSEGADGAAGVKYGVFAKGGSVGSQRFRDDPLKTFDTKEEAVADARRRRSGLSKGERGYYRMGYVVKPIKGEVEEGMIDNIKNTVRAANYDRLARRSNSQAVAGGGFAPPAQFKSLSAKGDQRAQKAQDIRKGSAQQVDEIDMGLVGDAMAGAAAGLGSVGLGSYIGHKIGNKIGQKFIDRSNRKKAEAGRKPAEAGSEKMKAIEKARADRIAANKAYRDHENLHGYELAQDHPEYQNRVNLGNKKFRNMDVPSAFDEEQQVYEKSESVRHGNNDHNVYHHVDESVDPIEQLRADIKRFAQ